MFNHKKKKKKHTEKVFWDFNFGFKIQITFLKNKNLMTKLENQNVAMKLNQAIGYIRTQSNLNS